MKRSFLRNCIQEIEMGKETINSNAFSGASSSLTLPFPVLVCIHNFWQGEIQSSNITSGSCLYSCCKTTEHSCDFTGAVTKTQQRENTGEVLSSGGQKKPTQNVWRHTCRGSLLVGIGGESSISEKRFGHSQHTAETKNVSPHCQKEGMDLCQVQHPVNKANVFQYQGAVSDPPLLEAFDWKADGHTIRQFWLLECRAAC